MDGRRKRQLLKESTPSLANSLTNGGPQSKHVSVLPSHSLTSTRIIEQLSSSQDLARMLADYRAKGGRIQHSEAPDPFCISSSSAPVSGQNRAGDGSVRAPVKTDSEEEKPTKPSDWTPKVRTVKNIISISI